MQMSDDDRKRLLKALALYNGATNAGEKAAACEAILRILGKYGLSWDDLFTIITASAPSLSGPTPIDLFDSYCSYFAHVSPRDRMVAAVWAMHLHVYGQFEITPRLAILTPPGEYGWGKSTLLKLIQHVAPRPMPPIDISPTPAALYQLIDGGATSLFLDEVDNLNLKQNGELRALLNAFEKGYRRPRGGNRPKKGGKATPQEYYPYVPVVVAAVGKLPRALITRCIPIYMELKPPGVTIHSIREEPEIFRFMANLVHDVFARWASNIVLQQKVDTGVDNRFADLWRPMVSIGNTMDGYGYKMQVAAKAITSEFVEYSESTQLLMDIRRVFNSLGRDPMDRISRVDLLDKLHDFEAWGEWGCNLTRTKFAAMLRERRVPPAHTIQHKGSRGERGAAEWGWYRKDYEAVWKTCPPEEEEGEE
jgi:hypothetical protein